MQTHLCHCDYTTISSFFLVTSFGGVVGVSHLLSVRASNMTRFLRSVRLCSLSIHKVRITWRGTTLTFVLSTHWAMSLHLPAVGLSTLPMTSLLKGEFLSFPGNKTSHTNCIGRGLICLPLLLPSRYENYFHTG